MSYHKIKNVFQSGKRLEFDVKYSEMISLNKFVVYRMRYMNH